MCAIERYSQLLCTVYETFAQLTRIFHTVTGANGRFKTGQMLDVGAEGGDVYNTMLDAMGTTERLGPADREMTPVDSILA